MADQHHGHVPLRDYIESLFGERTDKIMSQIELLDQKINRERSHLDEIMSLHVDMHRHEHDLGDTTLTRFEETMTRRMTDLTRTIEKLSDESSKFVRRDTVDERFMYMQEQIRKIEQTITELAQLVSATSSRRDANVFFIALGFTALNVMLNLVSVFN